MNKVLILNHTHVQCGVYQFGKRVYELVSKSKKVQFFHREVASHPEYIRVLSEIKPDYVIYNWHWDRMPWLTSNDVVGNQKIKHYFVYHDGSVFGNYEKYLFFGALDPKKKDVSPEKRILLPRPLFAYDGAYPINKLPTIGSFGFAFIHKRFPELVTLVNESFDKAVLNIHMTLPYFGDTPGNKISEIINSCIRNNVKKEIELNITHDFVDDNKLLAFLAKNDINVFNYSNFNNPGISSALDYALSVKRPIALSDNMMFRHVSNDSILLSKNSIKDILAKGTQPINKFYEDWSVHNFMASMEDLFSGPQPVYEPLISETPISEVPVVCETPTIRKRILGKNVSFIRARGSEVKLVANEPIIQRSKKNVLFLNHKIANCGVYQFGKRIYDQVAASKNVNYTYAEAESVEEFASLDKHVDAIIYNWHRGTMKWLTEEMVIANNNVKHLFVFHDVIRAHYDNYLFFGALANANVNKGKAIVLPRPLFEYNGEYPKNEIFTIGSFGFGFWQKCFDKLVQKVNEEFDEAIINLHLPYSHFGDPTKVQTKDVINKCEESNKKAGIKLNITQSFLTNKEVLTFLAGNDINAFFYKENDVAPDGLSSATDYALSVRRPIVITDCSMFRHFKSDAITLEKNSIREVYNRGVEPLEEFYTKWSPVKFIEQMDRIFI